MSTVVSVTPFHWGHASVVLSDGTTRIFTRGEAVPSVGDEWPPEVLSAVDKKTSEAAPVKWEPTFTRTAGPDEAGTAPESEDGPREEGHEESETKKD